MLKGKLYTSNGGMQYYWYYSPPGRNNPGACALSIDAGLPYEFRLDHEGKGHKLAEWLGFTGKFETGDEDFDAKVYIDCDDPAFCESLRNMAALRRVVLRLFEKGIKSFAMEAGRLVAVPAIVQPSLSENDLADLLAALSEFKRLLPMTAMTGQTSVNPTRLYAKTFRYVIYGVFALGVAATIFDMVQRWQMVQPFALLKESLAYALGAIAASLLVIKIVFHRSSYGYDVLRTFLGWGLLGAMACSYAALYNINIRYDDTTPQIFTQPVIDKYTSTGRHGSVHYHIRIQDWHGTGNGFVISTNSGIYYRAIPGITLIRIRTHPGYLGFEWMEGYEVLNR